MIVRELLTLIGFEVDKKTEKKAEGTFKRLQGAAGKLGIALSAGAVALGFKRVIDAASDAEETMNVVTTAFEDQTDAVLAWAKTSGEAAGRSEFAMRDYAATLGAVVGPTLGSAEATADLSTNMAQLAVDLGSFFNATDEEALDAIRAGLIGSQEPLLRFGVNMKVAALDAFALAEGLGKTTKDMTEAEKTMLRYRFILDRTQKAQGDAEKTSAGFANQSKRLQGNLKTLAVNIGKNLLPAAAGFLEALNGILKVISGPLVLALRAIGRVFLFVGATIGGIIVGIQQMGFIATAVFALILAKLVAMKSALVAAKLQIILLKLVAFGEFLLIAAAIIGIIAIIDDLWAAFTVGEGVLAGLGKEFMALAEENDSYLVATGKVLQNALDFWIAYFFGVEEGTAKMGQGIVDGIVWVGDFMLRSIKASNERIRVVFGQLVDWFLEKLQPVVDFLSDTLQPVVDTILQGMLDLAGFAADIGLGDLASTFGLTGPENIAAPGSPAAAAAAAANVRADQTINVNVDAQGGDPQAIAGAVAPAVGRAAEAGNRKVGQQLLAGATG